ncbi:CcdC family protein [Gorillibacterium massiliense]|uniref:CcdC family protein n=1 Tax=Gorillibacterium massiliense TaxID=1280390 RepID=UPI0004BAD99D|nr:cytochrome c biogenesis protein CcdC [Gorillibacterium massiliense]
MSYPLQLIPMFGMVVFALGVIAIRLKAAKKPTNARKILIPPLGMSTGFLMFVYPPMRIPLLWGLGAFLAGAVFFAYPLIRTSKFTISHGQIYLQRSKAFIVILLTLLVVRVALHGYVEEFVSLQQTAGLFFSLAFGMLLPWRVAMYMGYKKTLALLPGAEKMEMMK